MYFCMYKIKGHEIQHPQLLEMHYHAGLRHGNGQAADGIITQTYFNVESCGEISCNFFIL